MGDKRVVSMTDNSSIQRRFEQLEGEIVGMKQQQDKMLEIQRTISESLIKNNVTQETIAATLGKVESTMEEYRDFQVRTEESRRSDKEKFHRIERRIDGLEKEIRSFAHDFNRDVDALQDEIRKIESYCKEHIHKLDIQLTSGTIQQSNNADGVKSISSKGWQILFWLLTFLVALLAGNFIKK